MNKKKTDKEKAALKETVKKAAAEAKRAQEAADKAALEAKEAEEDMENDDEEDTVGNHDDADQDVALIKKMLKDYLGDEHDGMDESGKETMGKLAKEAYESHKEMGKKEDEAYKCAGEAVKLAHHMAKKQAVEKKEGDDAAAAGGKKPAATPEKPAPSDKGDDSTAEKKESNREKELAKKLLEAEGRLAALEDKSRKNELAEHADKVLRESGQPNSITKKFREAAGEFRSKKDFDAKWKVFLEGVKNAGSMVETIDWSVISEKSTSGDPGDDSGGGEKKFDFSDCAE